MSNARCKRRAAIAINHAGEAARLRNEPKSIVLYLEDTDAINHSGFEVFCDLVKDYFSTSTGAVGYTLIELNAAWTFFKLGWTHGE